MIINWSVYRIWEYYDWTAFVVFIEFGIGLLFAYYKNKRRIDAQSAKRK